MKQPGKKDEFSDYNDGCFNVAASGVLLMVGVVFGLGALAVYGVTEFLARV